MSRFVIEFPQNLQVYECLLTVRVYDLNYGNHLSNDRVLSLAHEARVLYLQSIQSTELNFFGNGIIMTDAQIVYKNEAFLSDVLNFSIAIKITGRASFDIFYRIQKGDKEIAIVKTGILCYDYERKKVVSNPEKFFSYCRCTS
ncbi:MAG: thioesterase family protein [Bacteroidetes bacterium]|nr:thioesterase family protein [Bacteroidota bacterium]